MKYEYQVIGKTKGHALQGESIVESYTLHNENGLSITIWTYGATLIEVLTPDGKGGFDNMVVRLPNLVAYQALNNRAYVGATMGRYARCISNSRFFLDEQKIDLSPNYGQHHFHGGHLGFDTFVWDAEIEQNKNSIGLKLTLVRPHNDQGYPGEITVQTRYILHADNTLIFEHQATTTMPTICDITNHSMWNLAGKGNINQHILQINADKVLLVNEDLIPKSISSVSDNPGFDFREGKSINNQIIDNCYLLEHSEFSAILSDPDSGRKMILSTDQPGLQVYTGDHFLPPRAGICLQTGSLPDSPVRKDFPSPRLDPGQLYLHRTVQRFENLIDEIKQN